MAGDLIRVRLVGPAKVGARWLKAAEEDVTAEELAVLEAEGLLDEGYAAVAPGADGGTLTFTPEGLEAEFQKRAIELVGKAFDGELGRMEAEIKEIAALAEVEKADLTASLVAMTAERDALLKQVADLQPQIATITAQQNSPAGQNAGEVGAGVATASPQEDTSAPVTNTPASEKAAKTAPKKGAAATTKG